MDCYRCGCCENYQSAEDPRKRGLCETKDEIKGPRTRACESFQLQWEIRRRLIEMEGVNHGSN